LSVPDEGYSRNAFCALHLIPMHLLLSLGRCLCWWTISEQIAFRRCIVCFLALFPIPWFNIILYFYNNSM